jgi:hypothetical protein
LSEAITPNEVVARIFGAVFGAGLIMFGAGWFSWRDFGDNRRRFFGGLLGGLLLAGGWGYWLFGRLLLS